MRQTLRILSCYELGKTLYKQMTIDVFSNKVS